MRKTIAAATIGAISLTLGALPALAAVSTNNDADLVEGNAFVRSSWVQAGLKENGTFGSSVDAPNGYNSLLLDADESDDVWGNLGLIADTDENGFGSDDDGGDFFLPGSPYEGWGIKVDGNNTLTNSDGSTDIPGSWTSSETSGDASVTWQSTDPADGIDITQVVSAPAAGDHLFTVTVTLENTENEARTVYYSRQVDPDNGVDPMIRDNYEDEDGYATFNRIIANSTSSQIVTGTHYYNYTTIGYRAADPDAVVRISDWSWPLQNDEGDELSEVEMAERFDSFREDYKVGFQDNLDSTIDIIFKKEIAAGQSAVIEFDYILDPRLVGVPEYALDLALDLEIGGSYGGTSTVLVGGGLKPNSSYTLTEYSVPNLIFSGTTLPNGNFYDETALPDDCRPGSHTLVLTGTSPSGTAVSDLVTYTVDENCTVTAFDPYAAANGAPNPGAGLADTGVEPGQAGLVAAALLAAGGIAVAIRRRKA